MTENAHNRLRHLRGLVTIDPWHEEGSVRGTVNLHAYVRLDEARLGGEQLDEVAFRLCLKRATVRMLQSEPKSFSIDPGRIWRGDGITQGSRQVSEESGREETSSRNLGFDLSPSSAKAIAGKGTSESSHHKNTVSGNVQKSIEVGFERFDRNQPSWLLSPSEIAPTVQGHQVLQGQPWDEQSTPLVVLRADRKHEEQGLLSSLKICIFCRSEDLLFHDVQVKDTDGDFVPVPEWSTKKLVIQEYLKRALISEELPAGNLNAPFAMIYLGEAISEPRKNFGDE